jgi:hypothetical protein
MAKTGSITDTRAMYCITNMSGGVGVGVMVVVDEVETSVMAGRVDVVLPAKQWHVDNRDPAGV